MFHTEDTGGWQAVGIYKITTKTNKSQWTNTAAAGCGLENQLNRYVVLNQYNRYV